MSSVIKNSGATLNGILQATLALTNVVTQGASALGHGADSLGDFALKHREKQVARDEVEMSLFYNELLQESNAENARREIALSKELKADTEFRKAYENSLPQLTEVVKKIRESNQERFRSSTASS